MQKLRTVGLVGVIYAFIVAANVLLTKYGISATPYIAAAIIGPVLVLRNLLNDSWRRHGSPKMLSVIAGGAVVSYFASRHITSAPPDLAATIATASALAFALSELVDWAVYQTALRKGWSWMARSSTSALLGASLDSLLFISIAFGFTFSAVFAQATAKIAGVLVYALLINAVKARRSPAPFPTALVVGASK